MTAVSTTTTPAITIEQLEALAAAVEGDELAEREHLHRLIRAYARIIAVREPTRFKRMATELSDVDGHFDNSYPPDQKYKDFSGPALLSILRGDYDTVATSSGFYHDWRAVTSDRGLYVARDGALYGRTTSGNGHYGQFAAHPGNCSVQLTLQWTEHDDVPLERLRDAERHLRELTFPLIAAKAAAE